METITVPVPSQVRDIFRTWAVYCKTGVQNLSPWSRISLSELAEMFDQLASASDFVAIPPVWVVELGHISLENDDEPQFAQDAPVVGAWLESVIESHDEAILRAAERLSYLPLPRAHDLRNCEQHQ